MPPLAPLARSARRASRLALCTGVLAALGCDGEVLNLGSSLLQAGGAGAAAGGPRDVWTASAQPLLPQESGLLLANPTLTAAMDELYYSAQRRFGAPDPNRTKLMRRARDGTSWSDPSEPALGDAMEQEVVSPAVSADGQELWLGMNLAGSTDIYVSSRRQGGWSTPTLVPELSNEDYDDAPRPPAVNGTIMPLSSKRHGGPAPLYQIYLSTRASADAAWSEPSKALLGSVDSDAFQSADGFLSEDGLALYFSSTRDGEHDDSDLYLARRSSIDAAFGEPQPLVDLNDLGGISEERMPWLSPDGSRLYFASDRSGQYALYVATKR